jgi:hypothetical protein
MIGAPVAMLTITDGRDAIGFVLKRGKLGAEAFDHNEISLGIFPTEADAANAVADAYAKTNP